MGQRSADQVMEAIVAALAQVPGVAAVTLGGSRSTGTAHANSDIDIGLYYSRTAAPGFDRLLECAARLDDRGRPDGHGDYGQWGPWINGGIWLRVGGFKTDLLLREIEHVDDHVRQCAEGRPQIHYQPGHPHGFSTAIYAGEVSRNVPLHDPDGVLPRLRAQVDPYPERLAAALVGKFGWEAQFALETAGSAADRGDLHYVAGCAFRAVASLNQVLFAANRRFMLNEKGATRIVETFAHAPEDYPNRVNEALGLLAPDPAALRAVLDRLARLRDEVLIAIDA
ncbi:nucleotidyltransferase domain-containing protein [Glycomyces tritici]|uniref:Nucleotidyltransferase domain-containing protein n=1 Tax=Glycomyces tritici TaxID=2665176 RepID=A0ABT7YWT6_9ACTN|nr:nucleotidyltransferase domain-containing protein [Glycomyces tritici]MDN3243110.1 nucleotidyltransferase domain-containing protein [Glycomyces tritici]